MKEQEKRLRQSSLAQIKNTFRDKIKRMKEQGKTKEQLLSMYSGSQKTISLIEEVFGGK